MKSLKNSSMPPTTKKNLESHSGYNKGTKLKWWGILLGDDYNPQFIVAAPTKDACLKAAERFHPKCSEHLISPIRIGSRVATLSRPNIRKRKISPDKEPSEPAKETAGKV